MKLANALAVSGAVLLMSAGIAVAAEACACCKDMAADAAMSCCDKMKTEPAPAPAPAPAPPPGPSQSPEAPSDDAPAPAS